MQVFLTGSNGWVGSMIARELLSAGHRVVGLVRSKDKADAALAAGVIPLIGSISDLEVIRAGASAADGVVHTAFGLDISKIAQLAEEDRQAIKTFGEVFAGSTRPIIVTSGLGLLPSGEIFTEDARPPLIPGFPRASEQTAFALADQGLHASVVRLPRSVHGQGENHGFIPMLAAVAREKGISAYVGDGQNLWPSVHRLDAARVFRLALEKGAQGQAFHAVADEGVPYRDIAEAIGRQIGVPAKSLTTDEANEHFGAIAMWVSGNGPASSTQTRTFLGWAPEQVGMIADIERPDYSKS